MPQLIRPPSQSQEVAMTIDIIGSRARTEILHLLSRQGPLTAAELTRALNADRSAIHRHLLTLETAGYVHGDLPAEERATRRTVRWTAVQERIDAAASSWREYAGEPSVAIAGDQPSA